MERVKWQTGDPLQKIKDRNVVRQSGMLSADVAKILQQVRQDGDDACYRLTAEYDGIELDEIRLSSDTIEMAADSLSAVDKAAIRRAYDNIMQFHQKQRYVEYEMEVTEGVLCERRVRPLRSVGLYIPGGVAPLFSSLLMQGVPAQIAGVREVSVCHPFQGSLPPSVAYAGLLCNVKRFYRLGGAQAIAAMALGTATVEPVDKIFGPGNQYVSEAKKQVARLGSRQVAVDLYAGPSEVLVLADETARSDFVAADLISQAEHGSDSWASLVTTSGELCEKVLEEVERQLSLLPDSEVARSSLSQSQVIEVKTREDMVVLANEIAPEHLIIQTEKADQLVKGVETAGSVFLGMYSPESVGDYASGTNHVLPTGGYARCSSGLSVEDFQRTMTVQSLTEAGLRNLGETVMTLARLEGLEGHARSVDVRLKFLSGDAVQEDEDG